MHVKLRVTNILIFNNSFLFEFIFLFTLFLRVCYPYLPEGLENPHSIQLLYVSSSFDGWKAKILFASADNIDSLTKYAMLHTKEFDGRSITTASKRLLR